MTIPRGYRQQRRAESAAATRTRIIAALVDLAQRKLTIEITLAEIAEQAGTTVQTVLRHFGSREGLWDAAVAATQQLVAEERASPAGDADEAMHLLLDHYEVRGDFMVRMVAQEDDPRIRAFVEPGKLYHRTWVAETFGPDLDEATIDLLVVATDLHTWKLLRRDRGLDRSTTETRMRALVDAVLTASRSPTESESPR